jgi:hypothetical protein
MEYAAGIAGFSGISPPSPQASRNLLALIPIVGAALAAPLLLPLATTELTHENNEDKRILVLRCLTQPTFSLLSILFPQSKHDTWP